MVIVCYVILWYARLYYDVLNGLLLPSVYIVALSEVVINTVRNKTIINAIDDLIVKPIILFGVLLKTF